MDYVEIMQEMLMYIDINIKEKLNVEKLTARADFCIKTKTKEGENSKAIPKFWHDYCTDGRQEKLHKELFLKSHEEYGACFPE
ncbi:MAG: hypothetical protein LBC52_00245, partial [Treponema sp.]|nr:hypothetical protein [Treponema sp.]